MPTLANRLSAVVGNPIGTIVTGVTTVVDNTSNAAATAVQDLADQARKLVNDAVQSVERTGSSMEQDIESASARAVQDAQHAANDAAVQINDTVTKARQDLLKLFDLIGNQVGNLLGNLPDPSMGSVNGTKFFTPADGYVLMMKVINESKPQIQFETHEPAIIRAFSSMIATSPRDFQDKMLADFRRRFAIPLPNSANAIGVDDVAMVAAVFTGIAACIAATTGPLLAIGVATLLVLLGVAIIYAINQGYNVKNVELGTGSGPDLRPTIKFSLEKAN
jgi:vacuolar-type H+-ATPase subunit H